MARRLAVLCGAVGMLTLFFWAGCKNHRERQAEMQQAQTAQITVTKDADSGGVPPFAGSGLVGKAAPAFTLADTSGKKVSLASLQGHAVVVNFWATWCGPCKQEMPWFEELSKKYAGQGLVMLGLDQDDGMGPGELATKSKQIGVSYPILVMSEDVDKAYGGVDGLPQTFYIDKSGKVVAATAGGRSRDEIEADMQKALSAGGM